jgi:hypothetical protein
MLIASNPIFTAEIPICTSQSQTQLFPTYINLHVCGSNPTYLSGSNPKFLWLKSSSFIAQIPFFCGSNHPFMIFYGSNPPSYGSLSSNSSWLAQHPRRKALQHGWGQPGFQGSGPQQLTQVFTAVGCLVRGERNDLNMRILCDCMT